VEEIDDIERRKFCVFFFFFIILNISYLGNSKIVLEEVLGGGLERIT